MALRSLALAAFLAAVLAGSGGADATSTNPKHFFWAPGQNPSAQTTANSAANDLIYHGGNAGPGAIGVETKPAVYLVWWGPQWADRLPDR